MDSDSRIIFKGKLKKFIQLPLFLTILFAALNVPVYMLDLYAGLFCSGFIIIYVLVMIVAYRKSRRVFVDEMIDFANRYGSVQRRLLEEFEIPYALLDQSGKILWINQRFSEVTGKDRHYHKSVTAIFPGITKELLTKEEQFDLPVTLEEKSFRASLNKIYFKDFLEKSETLESVDNNQFLSVLYLFDETELNYYKTENQAMQMVPALVYIDNYDEVMESIEEVKQSLLVALADRKVSKYFSNLGGLVKKTENDKYFVIFQHRALEQMMEEGFNILSDVQNIKIGNEIAMTLSIGIGTDMGSYAKNYNYARMAIDLALGRGGDQVVIKSNDKTEYFGGNTRQVDKNTRVKARVKALALREIIISKEKCYVMGHSIADVDAFGAAVGIFCAGRQLGKQVQIVIDEVNTSLRPIRDRFSPENGYPENMIISGQKALEELDAQTAVIVVDTNRPSYTECPALLKRAKTIVVFDHHRQGEEVIRNSDLSYIEPYASSACEMIAEVLQYFDEDIKLTPVEADAIYAGILIDTNNFVSKTGVRTFEAAAYLRRHGAEVTRVRKLLRNDMNAYKARAEAIRRAEVYHGVYAISICPADNIESPTVACAQAANELLNIIGIQASFVLTEYHEKIFVSARSIDEINVQRIMEKLGGGGHMNSAGAQLTGCTLEEAKQTIQNTLDESMKSKEGGSKS